MPIINLQRRQTEVGRIRLGTSQTGTSSSGKAFNRPVKLETFRFTSPSKALIEQVAALYGGQPEQWAPQGGGSVVWQVFTEAKSVPVVVPPNSVSQWYEHWTGGVCQRRCDGQRDVIADQPCQCSPEPDARECKPTTRISLMLAEVPGIGVWRLESHGFYAATELPAVAELLAAAGGYIGGRLELEERTVKRSKAGGGGVETRRWMVPVLHVDAPPAELLAIGAGNGRTAIGSAADRPALTSAAVDDGQGPDMTVPGGDDKTTWTRESWEKAIDNAANLEQLRQLWQPIGDAGFMDEPMRNAFWARRTQLSNRTQPDASQETEPDRDQVWSQILALASDRDWKTPEVSARMRQSVGCDPANADGWTLTQFRDAIKTGAVT